MWAEAIAGIAELSKKVFDWATGGRTKSENVVRETADHWKAEYDNAMARRDYVAANDALHQLRRVRDQARAQRGA